MEAQGEHPPEVTAAHGTKDASLPAHPMYTQEPRASFTPQYISPTVERPKEDFFIFRPRLLEQAIQDLKNQLSKDEDGDMRTVWILTTISHWGTENEVLVLLCDRSLLLCYYDFVGLCSSRIFRIPLNYIDTVTWGPLSYPKTALHKHEGPALQVQWDKLRPPPSFVSRWNPWADLPYVILTQHPGSTNKAEMHGMCQLEQFMEHLVESVRLSYTQNPLPGRDNGLLVLHRPVNMETSLGLISLLNTSIQLGYAKSRSGFGF
ncbi:tumor protein p63-regulated gene 1-like protein [Xenopus laevis]|uniref:Tumor protein p63-regulated gene 1-like protein n=2 Tax=Xenopus laevis TaxID=8355 RepID=A0A1L8FDW1_XENLA|nr:tumor protein p63-regulated gene 1-like protein [Xenopus laevis]XP_041426770.1 tumor protein p63-regulated gene 1-like protein [Xenopus laevis]OCT69790.1 hypothetical protein XELAEV_18036714mg [Xenopus laevis]